MIEFLLSLSPRYRALQLECASLRLERESLMRECDSARARVEDLQKVADVMTWRVTGRRIFNAAPDEAMPPTVENSAAIPSRTFARDLVRKGLDDFNEKMRKLA